MYCTHSKTINSSEAIAEIISIRKTYRESIPFMCIIIIFEVFIRNC